MFSGLFCVIEDQIPPPRVVRKPTGRPADATRKRTWRNSEALAMRKTQLAPTLRSLRPQQFQAEETEGIGRGEGGGGMAMRRRGRGEKNGGGGWSAGRGVAERRRQLCVLNKSFLLNLTYYHGLREL